MKIPYIGQFALMPKGVRRIFDTDGAGQVCVIKYHDPMLLQALNQFYVTSLKKIYIQKVLLDYRLYKSIRGVYICDIEMEPSDEYVLKIFSRNQ